MQMLVELIEKYRTGFSRSIAPASEESIEILEEIAGPLPGAYRRFLLTMGESMGDFEADEAVFTIESIWAAYHAMDWLRRDRYLLVALDDSLAVWDYYFDRDTSYGHDDCMLVRMRQDPDFDPNNRLLFHAGLEEYLYYQAYHSIRLPLLAHKVHLVQPADPHLAEHCIPQTVCALADELRFKRIPPADRCALYERGDAALLLYQHPCKPLFSFDLACHDPQELGRLTEIFQRRTGVVTSH
jgi:hypothetical protein